MIKKSGAVLFLISIVLTVSAQEIFYGKEYGDDWTHFKAGTVSDTINGNDTTRIKMGRREVVIIETEGEKNIKIIELEETRERETRRSPSNFKGHWSGLELGLNTFLTSDNSMSLPVEYSFMEIYDGRSRNWNLNFIQYDIGIARDQFGLVTGMGLEVSNYRFRNNNTIRIVDGVVEPLEYDPALDRSRLRTYYLTIPLILEVQFPGYESKHRRMHLSAGVITSVRIGSNTRVVYRENSSKQRERNKDDFYLTPFRYGFTARAGIRSINLFANYYMTPLFREGKGPELYPVSIGFSLSF